MNKEYTCTQRECALYFKSLKRQKAKSRIISIGKKKTSAIAVSNTSNHIIILTACDLTYDLILTKICYNNENTQN